MNEDEDFKLLTEASNYLFSYKKKPEKQEITIQLIINRNLISTKSNPTILLSSRSTLKDDDDDLKAARSAKAEKQADMLFKLTHIHLDRENIFEIDNLAEYLGPITNLYLQHNLIRKIENLEFLTNLKFLVLSNNQIEKIENLKALKQLKFLDLSNNKIEKFNVNELPISLVILDLRGNKCLEDEIEMKKLMANLKNIKQINGERLNGEYAEETSCDDDNNENVDERVSEDVSKMHRIGESIIERSKARQKEYEIKSRKSFALMKLELENSKKQLLEKLKRNNL